MPDVEGHGFTIVRCVTNWTDPSGMILVKKSNGCYGSHKMAKRTYPPAFSKAMIGFEKDKWTAFAVPLSWNKGPGALILGSVSEELPPTSDKLPEGSFVDRTSTMLDNGMAVSLAMSPGLDEGEEVVVIEISISIDGLRKWPEPAEQLARRLRRATKEISPFTKTSVFEKTLTLGTGGRVGELMRQVDAYRIRPRRERTVVGSGCAVCEEPLEHTLKGERILQFSCDHVAHEACFYEYIKQFESQVCPTCDTPLGLDIPRVENSHVGRIPSSSKRRP